MLANQRCCGNGDPLEYSLKHWEPSENIAHLQHRPKAAQPALSSARAAYVADMPRMTSLQLCGSTVQQMSPSPQSSTGSRWGSQSPSLLPAVCTQPPSPNSPFGKMNESFLPPSNKISKLSTSRIILESVSHC